MYKKTSLSFSGWLFWNDGEDQNVVGSYYSKFEIAAGQYWLSASGKFKLDVEVNYREFIFESYQNEDGSDTLWKITRRDEGFAVQQSRAGYLGLSSEHSDDGQESSSGLWRLSGLRIEDLKKGAELRGIALLDSNGRLVNILSERDFLYLNTRRGHKLLFNIDVIECNAQA
ncbi:hypothetical protein [Pseudomonas monteilii]|uniref:Uncharacterized protein n=1 Tax=Pseudomonas monteilii TaxID=76759 RepID=A0A399M3M2_9PSED|nr:hypothetical protein [Pseudomonas monteilii]RII76373.1 hypothetical protein D0894_16855 [Pseudomonas monteilii]